MCAVESPYHLRQHRRKPKPISQREIGAARPHDLAHAPGAKPPWEWNRSSGAINLWSYGAWVQHNLLVSTARFWPRCHSHVATLLNAPLALQRSDQLTFVAMVAGGDQHHHDRIRDHNRSRACKHSITVGPNAATHGRLVGYRSLVVGIRAVPPLFLSLRGGGGGVDGMGCNAVVMSRVWGGHGVSLGL
ncbi:hypothetical protein EX30DRAFT_196336 [Ascodesmis nigricans]|uniref:Uncharacterized protein n=1 Tax=Ascodesmis nigricans TaxID=341454 RepID=A0A4S2MKG5_9PEZI|nr:hypothetical protein EX30DRAFT_196336 [Ascodesmis nigricans]